MSDQGRGTGWTSIDSTVWACSQDGWVLYVIPDVVGGWVPLAACPDGRWLAFHVDPDQPGDPDKAILCGGCITLARTEGFLTDDPDQADDPFEPREWLLSAYVLAKLILLSPRWRTREGAQLAVELAVADAVRDC
jgi:hypothetical protein